MKRTFVRFATCLALAAIALASTAAHAGDHGKKHSASSQSGNGGGNGGGNGSSMKLHSNMSRNFGGLNANGGGGNGGNSSFNPAFSRKLSKSFSDMSQGNTTLPNLNSGGKHGQFSKNSNGQFNGSLFSDAIKTGKFRPIDSGIGNGIETKPGKFKGWNPEKLADVLKDNGKFPIGDGKFGDGGPEFDEKFGKSGKKDKDFLYKKNFPWWLLFNDCYPHDHHHHHHNHCYPPIYYCYPPANYTIINELPPLPAQPVLVQGCDLELVDLRLVDLGDAAKNLGPRYRITLRNRGTLPAGNFQVILLASSDGTPKPGLPSGVSEVAGLASGQLLSADVRLTLTPDLATMTSLIVAADSASQVVETEESNNVAVIDRAKVLMADLVAIPTP